MGWSRLFSSTLKVPRLLLDAHYDAEACEACPVHQVP